MTSLRTSRTVRPLGVAFRTGYPEPGANAMFAAVTTVDDRTKSLDEVV